MTHEAYHRGIVMYIYVPRFRTYRACGPSHPTENQLLQLRGSHTVRPGTKPTNLIVIDLVRLSRITLQNNLYFTLDACKVVLRRVLGLPAKRIRVGTTPACIRAEVNIRTLRSSQ